MDNEDPKPTCPHCESDKIETQRGIRSIPYGVPVETILEVCLPIRVCTVCRESYYDWEGEEAIQQAVDKYLASKGQHR